ncbi:MAG: hypothetical protein AB7U20_14315 [Planctomycetaceae bacterium]
MTTYFVATFARYVLVDAADEAEARIKGQAALEELVPGRPAVIQTIRHATDSEIDLMAWHNEMVAKHAH